MMTCRASSFSSFDGGFGTGLGFGAFGGSGSSDIGSDVTIPCRALASLKLSFRITPDAGAERNVVAAHQAVVNDHALERQQDRLRQDRQIGADQFLERLRQAPGRRKRWLGLVVERNTVYFFSSRKT